MRCLTTSGRGLPFTNTPPSWFTPPCPAGERQEKDTTPHTQQGPAISQGPRAAQDVRREQEGRKGTFLGSRPPTTTQRIRDREPRGWRDAEVQRLGGGLGKDARLENRYDAREKVKMGWAAGRERGKGEEGEKNSQVGINAGRKECKQERAGRRTVRNPA